MAAACSGRFFLLIPTLMNKTPSTPRTPPGWDEYFMLQALIVSLRSKDPSTQVGAVFVDADNRQIGMGYNGFVAGIDESQLPWGKGQDAKLEETKYAYVVHAEANAILQARHSLKDSRCYVTLFPCNECAKLIATAKISEVIYLSDGRDEANARITKKILSLSGVKCRQFSLSTHLISEVCERLKNL